MCARATWLTKNCYNFNLESCFTGRVFTSCTMSSLYKIIIKLWCETSVECFEEKIESDNILRELT